MRPTSDTKTRDFALSVLARLITDYIVPGGAWRAAGLEHSAITGAMQWLEANSEQNVSIPSLADVTGLSPYYLVRAFHRQVRVPPHRYREKDTPQCRRSRTLLLIKH